MAEEFPLPRTNKRRKRRCVACVAVLLTMTFAVSRHADWTSAGTCFFDFVMMPIEAGAEMARRNAVSGVMMVQGATAVVDPVKAVKCDPRYSFCETPATTATRATYVASREEEQGEKRVERGKGGETLYSFQLPRDSGFKDKTGALDAGIPEDLVHFEREDGSTITAGPLPSRGYLQEQRSIILGPFSPVKYTATEGQEDFEMQRGVKIRWAHDRRWVRTLKGAKGDAMIVLEGFRYEGDRPQRSEMEEILDSFRLGA